MLEICVPDTAADVEEPPEVHLSSSERDVNPHYQGENLVGNARRELLRLYYLGTAISRQSSLAHLSRGAFNWDCFAIELCLDLVDSRH